MKGMQPMMSMGLPMMPMTMPGFGSHPGRQQRFPQGAGMSTKLPPGVQIPPHVASQIGQVSNATKAGEVKVQPTGVPVVKTIPVQVNPSLPVVQIPQLVSSILKDGSPIKIEQNAVFIPEPPVKEEKLAIVSHNNSDMPKLEIQK